MNNNEQKENTIVESTCIKKEMLFAVYHQQTLLNLCVFFLTIVLYRFCGYLSDGLTTDH